jgi:uncharacterized protein (TIGR01777 family)
MRFLVAGASGFLGTRLRERLEADGHVVATLVRREPERPDQVRWDPYAGPLDPAVVDAHDVVVNLAGSPTAGNPHSEKWAHELRESRVTTTRVLAEAIAASESKPVFLAGNGISYYGDHGSLPLPEDAESRGDALLTSVTRDWQAATHAAQEAGSRVVVLRTSPVQDRRSMPLKAQRLQFLAGLGGRIGNGRQHVPMITTRDWTAAVVHCATTEAVDGPVNLVCEHTPTNAEFTRELAAQLHRPAVAHAPAFVVRKAAGAMAPEVLGSVNAKPARLLATGFTFSDPDVSAVIREALAPTDPVR